MKKFFASVFVAFALIAFVACESNPGIKATKEFMKNPTEKNLKKVDDIVDKMNDFEVDVFDDWCDEHEDEIDDAIDSL